MEDLKNQEPATEQTPAPQKNGGGIGPLLSIIVIIILLALGGFYYFTTGINQLPSYEENGIQEGTVPPADSDEISVIEEDLSDETFDDIDTLLEDIDADLQQI